MSEPAEIYCYADPTYTGNLDAVLTPLRERGHHVVVGADLEELLFLLELHSPTAIVYTLASESASLAAPFQTVSRRALELAVPMVLLGATAPQEELTLYVPDSSRFAASSLPLAVLGEAIEEIRDESFSLESNWTHSVGRIGGNDSIGTDLRDVIEDRGSTLEIETKLEATPDPRIITVVSRDGEILVREEQQIESDDSELAVIIETQHLSAVEAYAPAPTLPFEISGSNYRGEVSGPIVIERPQSGMLLTPEAKFGGLRLVVTVLVAGMVLSSGVALFLSVVPDRPRIRAVPKVTTGEPKFTPQKDKNNTTAVAEMALNPIPGSPAVFQPLSASDLSFDLVAPLASVIPFPGHFRKGSALFWFKDKWEEHRFCSFIQDIAPDTEIVIVGHPTVEEARNKKWQLGLSRAWSVAHFLKRHGIALNRIKTVRGRPLAISSDVDLEGNPRHRWVDLIFR